jgi:hypothetical protein
VAAGVELGVGKHRRTIRKLAVRSAVSEEVDSQWSMATRSQRKKWSEVESYPVARAQSCCYTFNEDGGEVP